MNKEQFVTYIIQHHEDFPNVGEIDLAAAQSVLGNLDSSAAVPQITPEEFVSTWNALIHDSKVMNVE